MPKHRVIRRAEWGAQPPNCRTPRPISGIGEHFLHWPGAASSLAGINTRDEEARWMREVQAFHMNGRTPSPEFQIAHPCLHRDAADKGHGWCDIGYTDAVFLSGRIYQGRGLQALPAAQLNHNAGTAAIVCVLGPRDHITPEMEAAVKWLLHHHRARIGHRTRVRPHSAVTPTTCPGPALTLLAHRLNG